LLRKKATGAEGRTVEAVFTFHVEPVDALVNEKNVVHRSFQKIHGGWLNKLKNAMVFFVAQPDGL